MQQSQITLTEFERIYQHDICKKDFGDIENFILKNSDENAPFLRIASGVGGKFIQARNYVGVLQTKSGLTIEILPKIADKNDAERSKAVFIKMLRTLKNFPFKISNLASLKTQNLPLLEIFISMFLCELEALVKKGIKSDYVALEENLNFLKGKLNINEQIKRNSIHKERFYVGYSEFLSDIKINRIIKTTLKFLYKKSNSSKNQQKIRELLFIFDEVSECEDYKNFFAKLVINRQIRHYEQTLLWCKIFLLNNSFTPHKGDDLALALLFDMNALFESYVGNFIKKKFSGTILQHSEKHLVEEPKSFKLRPDIFLKGKFIADTKWKIVSSRDDISQADLYQLYAYGKKHECDKLHLIYPKIDDIRQKTMKFRYDDEMWLEILYFDLEKDENNANLLA
ncbi:McrC family protein [Campylobacter concisus]|uniref:McrC family protein n=1 Tax=Campylobacter concisus TaxID=199 RepID=UPI00122C5B41|nr:McrC family protein [Campylobacter concisus]MBE9834822.1 McrC family protein [Campylobacter concisus]MBE9857562.1 McrC family protein [Campylobacter concisus]